MSARLFSLIKDTISIGLAALLILLLPAGAGECAAPLANSSQVRAEYWISKLQAPDEIIMSGKQIERYNRDIQTRMPSTMADFQTYPTVVTKQTLTAFITSAPLPGHQMYINGIPASSAFYNDLIKQTNTKNIKPTNAVRYGFTVARTNLRTFPTNTGVFATKHDREFDMFQETAVNPAEPVVILHESLRGDWFYVQTYNYRGWLPAASVAIAKDRKQWLGYINEPKYLVVTGNKLQITVNSNSAPVVFEMGAKLPLASAVKNSISRRSYIVKLPQRDKAGNLYFQKREIPRTADVHAGYLPYTPANVIRQAFKFYGQPYGWGGVHDSVDCSSLTMNVYRSFGIMLPRNADQQEVGVGKVLKLEGASYSEREKLLRTLQPGATLHMDGHVMLYLGRDNNKFYVIHSLASYARRDSTADNKMTRTEVMKVVVSDLDLTRTNGKTFLESLIVAKNIAEK